MQWGMPLIAWDAINADNLEEVAINQPLLANQFQYNFAVAA